MMGRECQSEEIVGKVRTLVGLYDAGHVDFEYVVRVLEEILGSYTRDCDSTASSPCSKWQP